MVHYTNQQNMVGYDLFIEMNGQPFQRKKHYWRLDTKSIIMYQDETSTRFFKEIPLNEVLDLKNVESGSHESLRKALTHFFEIRTQDCTYYIGKLIMAGVTREKCVT